VLWKRFYIQLTEAEWAFRITKDELEMPSDIWHQKTDRVLAHILICFLAYVFMEDAGGNGIAAIGPWAMRPRTYAGGVIEDEERDVVLPHRTTKDGALQRKRFALRCVNRAGRSPKSACLHRLGIPLPRRLRRIDEFAQNVVETLAKKRT